jgi:hypothetical protein
MQKAESRNQKKAEAERNPFWFLVSGFWFQVSVFLRGIETRNQKPENRPEPLLVSGFWFQVSAFFKAAHFQR